MPDILQDFPIQATPERVFDGVSTPAGLDGWWTKRSAGRPEPGTEYELDFGPGYVWRAVVTQSDPPRRFELRMTDSDADWSGTLVGFELSPTARGTFVRFSHPVTKEEMKFTSPLSRELARLVIGEAPKGKGGVPLPPPKAARAEVPARPCRRTE